MAKLSAHGALTAARFLLFTLVFVFLGSLTTVFVPSLRATVRNIIVGHETPATYVKDDQIDLSPSAYDSRDSTILVFVNGACGVCAKRTDFFRTLGTLRDKPGSTGVTAVFVGATAPNEAQFANEAGFDLTKVVRLDTALKVRRIPTLVGVRRSGRIFFIQEGIPAQVEKQQEILRRLEAARSSSQ